MCLWGCSSRARMLLCTCRVGTAVQRIYTRSFIVAQKAQYALVHSTLCHRSSYKRFPTSVLVLQYPDSFLLCRPAGMRSCALNTNDSLAYIFNSGVIYESTETYDEDRKVKVKSNRLSSRGKVLHFFSSSSCSVALKECSCCVFVVMMLIARRALAGTSCVFVYKGQSTELLC